MSTLKYPKLEMGTMEAVVNKLGGIEGMEKFLRGELLLTSPEPPQPAMRVDLAKLNACAAPDGMISQEDFKKCLVPRWRLDPDGTVYFTLVSDGWTGPEWIKWYDEHSYPLSSEARFILNSPDFKPTPKGTVFQIGVLPGKLWNTDAERTTANVRAEATRRGWKHGKIGSDLACLIRQVFSNQEIRAMGLSWINSLSEPISGSDGRPNLLAASAGEAGPWLGACWDEPGLQWCVQDGFAAVVPLVNPQVLDS